MSVARRRTGSKYASSAQVPISTGYQWVPACTSDRSPSLTGALVLDGARSGTAPESASGTPPLYQRGVPVSRSLVCVPRRVSTATFQGTEVKELRATLFASLPLRATLCCQCDSVPVLCAVTSSRAVWRELKRCKRAVFGLQEWAALVSSSESGRASPYDLCRWCETKLKTPHWKVTERDTLGQLPREQRVDDAGSTVGDVLAAWGLLLIGVAYADEVPA